MTDKDLDHLAVVKALAKAVGDCGWRLDGEVEAYGWRITMIAIPPLARPNPSSNRWPHEPEEQEEPTQEERVLDEEGRFRGAQ